MESTTEKTKSESKKSVKKKSKKQEKKVVDESPVEEIVLDDQKSYEILSKENYFVSDIGDYDTYTNRKDQKIIKSSISLHYSHSPPQNLPLGTTLLLGFFLFVR